jgi:hypothetical protein
VDIRVIGKLKAKSEVLPEPKTLNIRLHTRSIIRDGSWAFVGSQSLRALELDARREVGVIFRDPKVVATLLKTFNNDWDAKDESHDREISAEEEQQRDQASAARVAKKVAKAVSAEMGPVKPVVDMTMKELNGDNPEVKLNHAEMEATVKEAVKDAVRQVVRDFVEEAAMRTESSKA